MLLILALSGTTLNIMSLMGVVMMVGIVTSNSILIVEFTHRLIEDGMSVREAVSHAVRVRLRPVLMTSLATLMGLIPMALKLGEGSESYAPLARSIIGGLAVSVVLTRVYRAGGFPAGSRSARKARCANCPVARSPCRNPPDTPDASWNSRRLNCMFRTLLCALAVFGSARLLHAADPKSRAHAHETPPAVTDEFDPTVRPGTPDGPAGIPAVRACRPAAAGGAPESAAGRELRLG